MLARAKQAPVKFSRCYSYLSSPQSITIYTWTNIAFDANAYDTENFHSTSTNITRFTAYKDGFYAITFNVKHGSSSTGVRYARITKNGSATLPLALASSRASSYRTFNLNVVTYLSKNEYIECSVWHDDVSEIQANDTNCTFVHIR